MIAVSILPNDNLLPPNLAAEQTDDWHWHPMAIESDTCKLTLWMNEYLNNSAMLSLLLGTFLTVQKRCHR